MGRRVFLAIISVLLFSVVSAVSQSKPFTNADILQMTKAGFDEQTIIKAVESAQPGFDTSVEALVALKNAGVSEKVIGAMLDASKPRLAPEPVPPSYVNLATEAGVYTTVKDAIVEIEPELVAWRGAGFATSLFGLLPGETYGQIRGLESPLRLSGPLEFVIRCPEGISVTEYQLLRLDQKEDRREFLAVTSGAIHSRSGAEKHRVAFVSEKIAPRTYRVKLADLKKGEYGFLPPGATTGNVASTGKIYSFGVVD